MGDCRIRVHCSAILCLLVLLFNTIIIPFRLKLEDPAIFPYLPLGQYELSKTPRVTVRAFLLSYEGIPNYEAIIAWVDFHRKRWGLTHVDVFVKENLSEMRAILKDAFEDSVKFNVSYTHYHRRTVPKGLEGRIRQFMNVVLLNAKRENNSFVLFSDPDEFLVSEDFRDFEEMFKGGHEAVTFPVFQLHYHTCTDNALIFGSLGYQNLKPDGSNISTNASLDYYTDPPKGNLGHRKFVVRPERWENMWTVHDPLHPFRAEKIGRILDLSGRHQDGEHARLIHVRTARGIQADTSMNACMQVRSCKFLDYYGDCVKEREGARWEFKGTELIQLVKDRPLFHDAAQVSLDAVCYAERNPSVRKDFCDDDLSKCRYGAIYRNYHDFGVENNLTWGCKM